MYGRKKEGWREIVRNDLLYKGLYTGVHISFKAVVSSTELSDGFTNGDTHYQQ